MVTRVAFRPLLRLLNQARRDGSWQELKLLLKTRLFPPKNIPARDKNPLPPILFQMATGYWLSQAIYVAAKLGIADLLEDGPQSTVALAAATRSNERSLFRLLRALSGAGVFSQVAQDRFALSPLGDALRSNVMGSLRATVITIGEIHYQACGELLYAVRTGSPAFDRVFAISLFDYLQQNPEAGEAFNQGMTNLSSMLARAVLLAYDFAGIKSIVDVGGGQGELLKQILKIHPAMTGTVLDLPGAAGSANRAPSVTERCSYVAGSFFDSVPEGADAYILCSVVHDWSDDLAEVLLRNCRKAMATNARVLLLEMIVPQDNSSSFSKLLDLNMMVMTAGHERTKSEFHTLLDAAGFEIRRIVPTMAPQSIIEAVPK